MFFLTELPIDYSQSLMVEVKEDASVEIVEEIDFATSIEGSRSPSKLVDDRKSVSSDSGISLSDQEELSVFKTARKVLPPNQQQPSTKRLLPCQFCEKVSCSLMVHDGYALLPSF